MELVARVESGKDQSLPNAEARTEAVARVDTMFVERMRQIHIGPSLVYPAVGQASHTTIDYTATSDSYSTFLTSMSGSWSKRPRFENPPYTSSRGKNKRSLASSSNSKPRVIPSRIGKHIFRGRRRERRYSTCSCLCCTSTLSNALRVNDGPQSGRKTEDGWQALKLPCMDFGRTT